MQIARDCALQSTCLQRKVGCVIVKNFDNTSNAKYIVSTGYNGAPSNEKDCLQHNYCLRKNRNIPRGEQYELCRGVHAEMNALLQAGHNANGAEMYLYTISDNESLFNLPCVICSKLIINSRIKYVYVNNKDVIERYEPSWIYKYWNNKYGCD